MAYLFDIIRDRQGDFILLYADQTVQQYLDKLKSRQRPDLPNPRAVIIIREQPRGSEYYLFLREELPPRLAQLNPSSRLDKALALDTRSPTPSRMAYSSSQGAPARCVVLQDNRVIGFFDRSLFRTYFQIHPMGLEGAKGVGPAQVTTALNTELPEFLVQGETAELTVWLAPNAGGSGAVLPDLEEGMQVTIQITTGFGLELDDDCEREREVLVEAGGRSARVSFRLKARVLADQPREDGWQGQVTVSCLLNGCPLGSLTLSPTIFKHTAGLDKSRRLKAAGQLSPAVSSPADLTLTIYEGQADGQPALWVRLWAKPDFSTACYFGPVILNKPSHDFILDELQKLGALVKESGGSPRIAGTRAAQHGMALFDALFPADLCKILWERREQIKSIHIISNEAWIPWEIVFLYGQEGDVILSGKFFCEYQLTRGLPEKGSPAKVRLARMAVVAPGDSNLPMRDTEVNYLRGMPLNDLNIQVDEVPPTYLRLMNLLAYGDYTALHFTGHSQFEKTGPYHSRLLLEGGQPMYAMELIGPQENFGKKGPLVFMNSCQSAVGSLSLTHIDSWGCAFMKTGAAAFIGSMWSVTDQAAAEFAQVFYDALLTRVTVGEAVRLARQNIRHLPDLSWLAYTVYCNPQARYAGSA